MKYAIERQYLLPVYQHLVIEAETAEEACRKALDHDDWEGAMEDIDSARETVITALRPIPEEEAIDDLGGFLYGEKPNQATAAVPRQFRENAPPSAVYLILKSGDLGTVAFPDAYASRARAAKAIAEDVKSFGTDEHDYEILEKKVL
jgi:hypothetical protein